MRSILLFFAWMCVLSAMAQDSLQSNSLQEVVVTATRSERNLAELPVPVTVISQEQIKSMGALRLNDVLSEQTGLTIVSDHGTGIQVQGFAPEYTLILVDGEPLIGRTAGTLELNRIAVGNIQRIEIIKGPSSSLYGTEALAGVINIITEKPGGVNAAVTARYGSNNTTDLGGTINYKKSKWGLYAFVNRYSTDGYDLDDETKVKTVSPFYNYTAQARISYHLTNRTEFSVSGRYFRESQHSYAEAIEDQRALRVESITTDWNVNPVLSHRFTDKFKSTFRFYASGYANTTDYRYQSDNRYYDSSFFRQGFYRPELQGEYFINSKNILTLGAGRIWETVEATRYEGKLVYHTNYIYAQYEWQPSEKWNLIAGGRYDHNLAYTAQFSPKLSAQYNVNTWLSVRASYGVGFRAPDFRQLYLNFTNNTVGYSVFGSQELATGIQRLIDNGEIINPDENILVDPSTFGAINPETSRAYNLGFKIIPLQQLSVNVGLYRNDISDLIDTKPIARKTNSNFVYSYYNLNRVFTQGVDVDATYSWSDFSFALGYQYLIARDKDVVRNLEAGKIYKRDPETNLTTRVSKDEYGGLFNRSKHMANVKVFYQNSTSGWGGSFRAIYRGRYGFADMNSSLILDDDSEYVDGYVTCNVTLSRNIGKLVRVQVGCDNLFDYTDPQYIASMPGRLLWMNVGVTLGRKDK